MIIAEEPPIEENQVVEINPVPTPNVIDQFLINLDCNKTLEIVLGIVGIYILYRLFFK